MKIEEAGKILNRMYLEAPEKEKALSVHLFGIKFADQIRNMPSQEIAIRAGLTKSYGSEIRKGVNLSKYVELKKV